jgi:hypothetical protein
MILNQAKSESYTVLLVKKKHHIRITMGKKKKNLDVANGITAMNADKIIIQNVNTPPIIKKMHTNPIT